MIVQIDDFYELNKLLRLEILAQTGLPDDHVLNGLSVRGAELEKRLEAQKLEPFAITDNFIVFELTHRNSSSNVTQTIGDDLYVVSSYNFKLIIYGLSSMQLAQIIRARFESEEVRQKLFAVGIYIEGITDNGSINQFINSTMWIRTDISIEISCESKFTKETLAFEFAAMGELTAKAIPSQDEPTPPHPVENEGRFSGYVREIYTNRLLSDVRVHIYSADWQRVYSTFTNENGYYESSILPFGEYLVEFSKDDQPSDALRVNLETEYLENQNVTLGESTPYELKIVMTFGDVEFGEMDYEPMLKTNTGYYVGIGRFEDEEGNLRRINLYNSPEEVQYYYGSVCGAHEVENDTTYRYYIVSYSEYNPQNFANSRAQVKVYLDNELLQTLNAPSGTGQYWDVLEYSKTNGLTIINEITNIEPEVGS